MPEIRMPKMGDGMEEGKILRWLKAVGDSVNVEEPIAEIETDKANVEIPAEDAGVLTGIVVKEGETVPIGTVIGFIGESAGESAHGSPAAVSGGAADAPAAVAKEAPAPAAIEPAPLAQPAPVPVGRVRASGLARKVAAERGIDLRLVTGSGPGGRIVEKDVLAFQPRETAAPTRIATAAPSLEGRDVPLNRMRKAIARRTVQSKQTVPHFYLVMPVEMDRSADLLQQLNAQNPDDKITFNDLVVRACAMALLSFPEVNTSFTPDETIRFYDSVNIGVAVGTDDGLRIPVLKDCQRMTLREIASATKGLVKRAREGTLTPQEMSGGTFTVSNLGMFGVEEFAAIINPPESAILAVGAIVPEVVVGSDGRFEARKRMRITLSCDHRTVDGLLGARFLRGVKDLLESPTRLLTWS